MENIHGFDFFRLHYDADGKLEQSAEFDELKQHAEQATDAIFLAHGFRNDEQDASSLYSGILDTLRGHFESGTLPSLGDRKVVVAGVYWPSKSFRETSETDGSGSAEALDEESAERAKVVAQLLDLKATVAAPEQKVQLDEAIALLGLVKESNEAQDRFTDCVLSLLKGTELDPTEGLDRICATNGSVLLRKLALPAILATSSPDGDEGRVTAIGESGMSFDGSGGAQGLGMAFGSIFGRIGTFLNLTTWYTMKHRCGVVGAAGVARDIRNLKVALPALRVHLVGHSLGGRLMAACAKALTDSPLQSVNSVSLLEAAFSHFGFSTNDGRGHVGFFRPVIEKKVVNGPLLATFSVQDTVVGRVYALASRLAGDTVEEIGDANDPYGGIGRNGAQKTVESRTERLHNVGTPYQFPPNMVLCLDGTGGLIKDHGDVRNATVTYAVASAIAASGK